MTENIPGSSESFDTPQTEVPNPSNTPDGSKSFYAPPSEGSDITYDQRIADPNIAQEIAITERNLGVEAALRQEQALRIQSETGMTEEEGKNQEIMDKLLEKYPDAFETMILEDGTKVIMGRRAAHLSEYRELSKYCLGNEDASFVLSKDGLISFRSFGYDNSPEVLARRLFDVTKQIRSREENIGKKNSLGFVLEQLTSKDAHLVVFFYNKGGLVECSKDAKVMMSYKELFTMSQVYGASLQTKEQKSTDEILGML